MAFGAKRVLNFFAPDLHAVFYGIRTAPWTLVVDLKSLIAILPKTKELDFALAMAQIYFARRYWQNAFRQGANMDKLPPGLQFVIEGRYEDFKPWNATDGVSLLRWQDDPDKVPGGAVPFKKSRESYEIYDGEIVLNVAYGYIWQNPAIHYHVLLHELGHILGFGHVWYKDQEYGWGGQGGPPSVMDGLPQGIRNDYTWISWSDIKLCWGAYTYLAEYWNTIYMEPWDKF